MMSARGPTKASRGEGTNSEGHVCDLAKAAERAMTVSGLRPYPSNS